MDLARADLEKRIIKSMGRKTANGLAIIMEPIKADGNHTYG